MGTVFLTALTVAITTMVLVLFFKILGNVRPGSRKIQADLKNMKKEIAKWVNDLVPISKEEMEQFSYNQINQVTKKGLNTTSKGVFTTIYHEAVVAYSFKKYLGSEKNALLYARTAGHEYTFRFLKKGVQVVIDKEVIGMLKPNGVLYSAKKNRMLARINREQDELTPIIVKDREVGNVVKALPEAKKGLSPRSFEFLKEDINEEEKALFLSLAILEMVEQTVGSGQKN